MLIRKVHQLELPPWTKVLTQDSDKEEAMYLTPPQMKALFSIHPGILARPLT